MYIDNIMYSIHTRYYTIETLIWHLVIKYCIYFEISKIRLQHQQLLLFRELTVFTLRRVSHKSHVWKQRLGFSKASSFQNIVDGIVKGTPGLKVKDDRLITLFGETAGSMIHLWRLNLYDSFDKIFWEHIIICLGFYWFWNCVCVWYILRQPGFQLVFSHLKMLYLARGLSSQLQEDADLLSQENTLRMLGRFNTQVNVEKPSL